MMDDRTTLPGMLAMWSRDTPAAPAVGRPEGPFLDHRALGAVIEQMGAFLDELGITRGARVALHLPDALDAALGFLAVASRAACAPMNPRFRAPEAEFHLRDLEVSALIVSADEDPVALDVATRLSLRILRLTRGADGAAVLFAEGARPAAARGRGEPPASGDPALLLHTSGTTARPKVVSLSHGSLCASARNIAATLELVSGDRCLEIMPLFHVHGLVGALLSSLSVGASVALPPEFSSPRFLPWLAESGATWYTAVPTIHLAVLAQAAGHPARVAGHRLRFIRSSSAALPPQVMAQLEAVFAVPVIEAYAMTEGTHQIASNPLPPRERRIGSVGLPTGTQIAIFDPGGAALPPDVHGEVHVRGPTVIAAYARDAAVNAQSFRGDWLRTGDAGYLDRDGYLYLSGRLKEMINRGGEKVSPLQLETVLLDHPAIAEAAVFAVPHPSLGEDIAAAVVAREGHDPTGVALRAWLAERVADTKLPHQIIVVDAIPRGSTGKVQRLGLAAALADRLGAPYVAPGTPTERVLAAIWRDVLGVERIGTLDNFIAIGGDSLKMVVVVARARAAGLVLSAGDLFQHPTIAGCATLLDRPTSADRARGGGPRVAAECGDPDRYPMTPHQELLVRFQRAPRVPHELLFTTQVDVTGPLDPPAFEEAWREAQRAHPILRTAFVGREQQVRSEVALPWRYADLSDEPAARQDALVRQAINELLGRGMSADEAPLLRVSMFRLAPEHSRVVCIWHHAIMDLWLALRVLREVLARHEALVRGARLELPAPRPFRDYVIWVAAHKDAPDAEAFWRRHLAGLAAAVADGIFLNVPAAWLVRRSRAGDQRRTHTIEISREAGARLARLARRHGLTTGTLCYGAWALMQSRLQGSDDLVFTTTTSGRWADVPGITEMIGPVFTTQPFRVQVPDIQAAAWLDTLQVAHAEVQRFDYVAEDTLQRWIGMLPPSWCVLIFQNMPPELWSLDASGLTLSELRCDVWLRRPLAIFFFPSADGCIRIQMIWDPDRFTEEEIAWIGDGFPATLDRFAADASAPVRGIRDALADPRPR